MPPTWMLLPILLGVGALSMLALVVTLRVQHVEVPVPLWWRRVPALRRRLAYAAAVWQLASTTLLLWAIDTDRYPLPPEVSVPRALIGLVAWAILGWVAITAYRRRAA